jgi:hypothetical protein
VQKPVRKRVRYIVLYCCMCEVGFAIQHVSHGFMHEGPGHAECSGLSVLEVQNPGRAC